MRVWATAIVLFLLVSVDVAAQDRFVSKLKLPTGATVVMAEGDFEARSIGSFSVRLYEAATAPNETTFFSSGVIRSRDGVVDSVVLADIDADQQPEIVVIVRSAGTKLLFRAALGPLAADADPVAALRKHGKKRE